MAASVKDQMIIWDIATEDGYTSLYFVKKGTAVDPDSQGFTIQINPKVFADLEALLRGALTDPNDIFERRISVDKTALNTEHNSAVNNFFDV